MDWDSKTGTIVKSLEFIKKVLNLGVGNITSQVGT